MPDPFMMERTRQSPWAPEPAMSQGRRQGPQRDHGGAPAEIEIRASGAPLPPPAHPSRSSRMPERSIPSLTQRFFRRG